MLIVFCKECGRRVSEDELSSGKARRVDEMEVICAGCDPAAKSAASSSQLPGTKTGKTTKAARRITTMSATTVAARSGENDRVVREAANHKIAIIAIGAGVCLLTLGVMIFSGGGKTEVAQAKTETKADHSTVPDRVPDVPERIVMPAPAPTPPPIQAKPVEVAANPQPEPVAVTQPSMLSADADMANMRLELAASRLKEAQDFASANPQDPWTYKEKLESVAHTYRSTPAGDQASKILADLKVPEKPKPVAPPAPKGDGEWKPIFDGKSIDNLQIGGGAWQLENGALVNVAGKNDAPQSRQEFPDAEFRFRFEVRGCTSAYICVRQGSGTTCDVRFNRDQLSVNEGKTRELIVTCAGDQVVAKLDGQPISIGGDPKAGRSGRIQFNCRDGNFRLLSIDQRKIAAQ